MSSTTTLALLKQRIAAARRRLAEAQVDALLITHPPDIRYLTGFVGDDSWAVLWQDHADVHVLSDFRFEEQIQHEAPQVRAIIRKKSLAEELARLTQRRKVKRLGLPKDHVTLALRAQLGGKLKGVNLKAMDDGLLEQRAVKDDEEIKAIVRALKIQEQAFQMLCGQLKPGMTEVEAAGRLEYLMRQGGADGTSFPSIVAADANASLPHAIPGRAKLRKGGIVLIDWGAKAGGYCSDLTRVVGLGGMSRTMQEIYRIVLEAQMAAIDAIAPGKTLQEIDAVARGIIAKAGYGKQFGHSLGHGIGLLIHEQPTLSPRSTGRLLPGHVVTVEPGIYLPGVGGVRIEDDVLVTDGGSRGNRGSRGHRVLSTLPKDLKSAMI
ncbi:MAG: aminopeptidase P family protein [Phycisphaeraceae bacterium]|nr:aminopeptidase P family protein [Phycisphaeraceae bacterium]